MKHLKQNTKMFMACIVALCFTGCSIASFCRIIPEEDLNPIIEVSPDRLEIECQQVTDEYPDLRGFMIHVLDNTDTYFSIIQGGTIDSETCNERMIIIKELLKAGMVIKISGHGELEVPSPNGKYSKNFSKHGIKKADGRVLQFMYICNEKMQCFPQRP